MADNPSVLIDGITSVSTHNGITRVVCYKFKPDGQPEPSVELILTPQIAQTLAKAFGAIK